MAADLPPSLVANPRLASWVSLAEPGSVTVSVGKVELGQGIATALAQVAAEELDVDPARVAIRPVSTAYGPDEGVTSGSMSIAHSGAALRQVCAEVRMLLLAAAGAKFGRRPDGLSTHDGDIRDRDGQVLASFWDLVDAVDLDRDADGAAHPRRPAGVAASPARTDLPDKVLGRPRFVHDLALAGQVYGRVVRPPSRGASLVAVDERAVDALDVLAVVRDGDFLGVVAEREEAAVRAAQGLARAARWDERDTLPGDTGRWLRSAAAEEVQVGTTPAAETDERVIETVHASYTRPFLAHASIAPSCGIARWRGGLVTLWSHTQSVHGLRRAVAQALGLHDEAVVVHHVEGAGCYGHNAADDAAFDAVLLARAVPGRPVQVLWSRGDELGWAPFGPATVIDMSAGLDTDGRVISWRHEVWSNGHVARPGYAGTAGLLAAGHVEGGEPPVAAVDPPLDRGGGQLRNAEPIYDFPVSRVVGHRVMDMPLRTSALRSLGAFANVFAIESFLDELALRCGADPVEFRLDHLSDERGRAVVELAAERAGWSGRTNGDSRGRGIGFARYKGTGGYCAVVAEVEAVHAVRVLRLVVAADVGRVVSGDGVANQVEGGAVQATSWTLLEQVHHDRRAVTSTDWETYPILRFSAVPEVVVEVLDRRAEPSLGAGEIAQGPTAAAIANAVADALGVRVRDLPLTPERVLAAIGV